MVKIGEQNNISEHAPDNQPKNLHLGEDFEIWLKGREDQKNFLEKQNNLNTQSELADLKESLGKKPFEKIGRAPEKFSLPSKQDNSNHSGESVAFTEKIYTRQVGDEGKNVLGGLAQSISVPLKAFKDGIIDVGRLVFSPIKETQRTIAYLEEESSAKII